MGSCGVKKKLSHNIPQIKPKNTDVWGKYTYCILLIYRYIYCIVGLVGKSEGFK